MWADAWGVLRGGGGVGIGVIYVISPGLHSQFVPQRCHHYGSYSETADDCEALCSLVEK